MSSADVPPLSPTSVRSQHLDDVEASVLIVGGGPHALAVLSALHEKSLAFAQFASDPVFNQRVGIDSLQKIGTAARASLEQRAGTAVSVGSLCIPTFSYNKSSQVKSLYGSFCLM